MLNLQALDLARIQFAFTVSFHIIFPAITIGLASFLAVLEGLWLKSGNAVYKDLYKFWSKIFAVNFGMGVVSGLVMAYEFGTNWARFSDYAGSITGPLLTYEVLTAFFLEAGFLGVMLFGWDRVGRRLHFFATVMVAIGTMISMFWILSSNSWMQTPQGIGIVDGRVVPLDWLKIVFNPSFPYRLVHMALAAYLSTAFFVGASAAWHLLRGRDNPATRTMLSMAMWMVLGVAPLQVLVGDAHGLNTLEHQPAKIAAIEGHWENEPGEPTPLILFGIPDMQAERTRYSLEVPYLGSLILTHSLDKQIPALKSFAPQDRPNSTVVFWSFRLMAGLGMLMILCALAALVLRRGGALYRNRAFLGLVLAMGPSGLIALLAGWFTTEMGRQPWVVYGMLRTSQAVSNHNVAQMSLTLALFVVIYFSVFTVGLGYMMRLVRKGPGQQHLIDPLDSEPAGPSSIRRPMSVAG
ncbi:cytochrome d ubiquinol oxidase subunit I [Pseudomonas citronellolis]|uniref:cytochrome ubiquinol oxidase subunit I n=1 Tax=Pseudomonas citronellolis TaxID=53408 RepID=UPI00209DAF0D|nr:cytochrome ubiquinol oxidase subunit I [Pseudomonas citronellolis]MCP1645730.1 cytochrome d ubiquinol oxidase subunit I [Pseudomonas citronellolis]MCP1668392.1 cytochrome d ubiquinol oxidase subunit I [Pseudomonas citronellolis]MCP1700002.1 cytochrome d ubiquinol oxidase subunit I [Pseudomonas citronellolis]MCP1706369.1 cytochrome d ubiquinol oxidase subunit I [Pseudomonas citronellolis]MCP1800159.1 cytochrome d ubiquinol oxidase subunit I [Pseudomonas citronellolis]